MPNVVIYHNPRCSKSRATLALLQARGIEPEVIHYLETPLTAPALRTLLAQLGLPARSLLRKEEAPYKSLHLGDLTLSDDKLIDAMAQHPVLMQRPIVVANGKAAIGRPPEHALTILE